ncbi:unnamed protein product [Rotaria magnacalcarata]|uniref:EF-hand domain-containing protein n=2 Tax=Rotaria magnacalcarata TaxID=392030 RepID=A0A815B3Q1_9BILA|nr:unnamed protein product [Rotaria magnacalcarata]CAF1268327.1 unnamed protein product [Rotaria magnacalcarata]CAF1967013.1 unnamed protein product [Rotaria magnacalcarata]CAF2111125.1 unnamed protein product [Rotaria magnacalcarata]
MAASTNKSSAVKDDFKNEFRLFDANNDGFIDKDELKLVLKKLLPKFKLPDDEIKRMISNVDRNNDGKIDYHEFMESIYPQLSTMQ